MARPSSRDLLLDTAERLFAQRGIDAFSLREINEAAGLSSAAIHYHFKTKENLLRAILQRRLRPDVEREGQLHKLYAKHGKPKLRNIVEGLVLPLTIILLEDGEGGRNYLRIIARIFSEHGSTLKAELPQEFQRVIEMVANLIPRALPELPLDVIKMRHAIMIETMLTSLANSEHLTQLWALSGSVPPIDIKIFAERLIDFLIGGLSAPVAAE
ncbi:MAG TPA: TetR/AcrR family transcriptional regulator [Spongiibacteraceae bacterium]|jgi:AcrR family transcriptional regulator